MCAGSCIVKLNKNGMKAFNDGDHLQAEAMLRSALDKAVGKGSKAFEAKVRNNLALVLQSKGLWSEAAQEFEAAIQATEERIGKDNPLHNAISVNFQRLQSHMENVRTAA